MFILASSVCKSIQCLVFSLTQRGKSGHLFRLTCSVVLWGGRDTANKYHWHVWGVITVYRPHCICPSPTEACAFLVYTALVPGCSPSILSKEDPVFHALPRSKPLRFRFSGTPQRHRLGWACVLCLSQVQEAQTTRLLASTLSQVGHSS